MIRCSFSCLLPLFPSSQRQVKGTYPSFFCLLASISLRIPWVGLLPGTVSASTVTITPASTDLKQTYTISAVTGTPDASKQQVQATGTATTSGTHATGTLTI